MSNTPLCGCGRPRCLRAVLVAFLVLATFGRARAQQTYTFTGAVSTSWMDPLNWEPQIVPFGDPEAIVVLPAGKMVEYLGPTSNTIYSLQMGAGSELKKHGELLDIVGPSVFNGKLSALTYAPLRATNPKNVLTNQVKLFAEGQLTIVSMEPNTNVSLEITSLYGTVELDVPNTSFSGVDIDIYETTLTCSMSRVTGNVSVSTNGGSAHTDVSVSIGDVTGNLLADNTDESDLTVTCGDVGGNVVVSSSGYGCQPCSSSSVSLSASDVIGYVSISSAESGASVTVNSCNSIITSNSSSVVTNASFIDSYSVSCSSGYYAGGGLQGSGVITVGKYSVSASDYQWGPTVASAGVSQQMYIMDKLSVSAFVFPGSPYGAYASLGASAITFGPSAIVDAPFSAQFGTPAETVVAAGSVRLEQTVESLWDFQTTLVAGAPTGGTLEVAGTDFGVSGYTQLNFNIGRLSVDKLLHLVDEVDNGNRGVSGSEALYLPGIGTDDGLMLPLDSVLHLHHLNAYARIGGEWVDLRSLVPPGQTCVAFQLGQICLDRTCYADCDGNGVLNVMDYACFSDRYALMEMYADCDNSGSFNVFDYICFGNAFAGGCP